MANLTKSVVLSAAIVVGATLAANAADGRFDSLPRQPSSHIVAAASSVARPLSNYDPYADGMGPCTLGSPNGGPKCNKLIPPDFPRR
jgi:hypothetical protein